MNGRVLVAIAGIALAGCSTSTPNHTVSVKSATSPAPKETSVAAEVGGFYGEWLAASKPDPQTWVDSGYLTQHAADQIRGFSGVDQVTCSDRKEPFDKFTFPDPTLTNGTGTMTVKAKLDFATIQIAIGLKRVDGSWRIDSFECLA